MEATGEQWALAQQILDDVGFAGRPLATADEVFVVLDADANGDDVQDNLEEHRMWRTPLGRRAEQS